MKDQANVAFQAGANMQKQKGKPFVSPVASGGTRRVTIPPDFARWSTDKQKEWLGQHGFVKPDVF